MKWIKLAAIIGFVFAGLVLISLILGMVGVSILSEVSSVIIIIFFVIFLVAFFFFMLGFVKVGQGTGHKLLRVSSWMIIVSAVVGVLFILIFGLTNIGSSDMQGVNANSIDQATIDEINAMFDGQNVDFNYDGNSILTGNAIGSLFSTSTAFGLILMIILVIFSLVSVSLFLVSIAEHRDKVRYSRQASFFPIFTFNAMFLIMMSSIFIAFMFMSSSGGGIFPYFLIVLPYIFGMLSTLFLSLFLLDASKRFEGFENVAPPQEYREYSPYPPRAKVRAMTSV